MAFKADLTHQINFETLNKHITSSRKVPFMRKTLEASDRLNSYRAWNVQVHANAIRRLPNSFKKTLCWIALLQSSLSGCGIRTSG
eukprot:5225080-Amphidinium_carterae.1